MKACVSVHGAVCPSHSRYVKLASVVILLQLLTAKLPKTATKLWALIKKNKKKTNALMQHLKNMVQYLVYSDKEFCHDHT